MRVQIRSLLKKSLITFFLVGISGLYGQATLFGPTPYLEQADSPFAASFDQPDFFFENFESGVLGISGVIASAGAPFGPSGNTDSVDIDDGNIDGFGTGGFSFFSGSGAAGITFSFDVAEFGVFPKFAGIVWTDGFGTVTFEAFDPVGTSLGTLVSSTIPDGTFGGTTGDDHFFGVANDGGIGAIFIQNSSGGIEVDHLQLGLNALVIPEPSTVMLMGVGLATCAVYFRRKRSA